ALLKYILQRRDQNKPIEGLEYVRGRSRRTWNPNMEPTEIAAFFMKAGVENPWKEELKNLGDMEEELKAKGYKKKDIQEAMNAFTVKPEGKIKVVLKENIGHYQTRLLSNVPEETKKERFDPTAVFDEWQSGN